MNIDSVGIIGGGAWGTALAQAMRRAGRDVVLWAREPEEAILPQLDDKPAGTRPKYRTR